jgi:hypothetical protein
MMFRSRASVTAWARSSAPSFIIKLATWFFTVEALTSSSSAIRLFEKPRAISFKIAISRGDSSGARRRSAMAAAIGGGMQGWPA